MSELCVSHLSCVTVVYLCRCRVRYLHSARASTRIIYYVMYIIIKMYNLHAVSRARHSTGSGARFSLYSLLYTLLQSYLRAALRYLDNRCMRVGVCCVM